MKKIILALVLVSVSALCSSCTNGCCSTSYNGCCGPSSWGNWY